MINGSRGRLLTITFGVLCVVLAGAVAVLPVLFHGIDVSGLQTLEGIFIGTFFGSVAVNPSPHPPKPPQVIIEKAADPPEPPK